MLIKETNNDGSTNNIIFKIMITTVKFKILAVAHLSICYRA